MKKLFRLLIAVFCIFFALRALPSGSSDVIESVFKETAGILSEGVVVLSEYAHDLTGVIPSLTEQNSGAISPVGEGGDPGNPIPGNPDPVNSIPGNPDPANPVPDNPDPANPIPGNPETADSGQGGDPGGSDPADIAAGAGDDSGGTVAGSDNVEAAAEGEGLESANAAGVPQEDTVSAESAAPAESYVRQPVSDDEIFYYYYTRISEEERLLYDAMLALALNQSNDGSYEESRLLSLDPASEDFSVSYTRAFNALINDHPELFWVSMSRAVYQCRYYVLPSFGGQYKVILSLVFPDSDEEGGSYSGIDLRNKYNDEMNQLRYAADVIYGQVDFTQSDAGIALQLHDILLNCAWYNRDAGFNDYAHTAYGALVTDSSGNPGGALCDGYSLAYVYLLQRAGITAAMISGNAGSSESDLEKHAWNIVCLDNEWYEVDATWNDLDFSVSPDEEGYDLLMEALSDEAYMARIRHYMFNRTTVETRSFTPGEEYRYSSSNGWVSLLQPSVHIRFSDYESEESRDYITPLAPEATGTYYTWDMLAGY